MIRVYIAAPYPAIAEACLLAADLAAGGIECTSRWLFEGFEALTAENAGKDLADVARCDVFVAFNPASWAEKGTGGRHVELGFALALWKPVVLVGVKSNIFHELPQVRVVGNDRGDIAVAVAESAAARAIAPVSAVP